MRWAAGKNRKKRSRCAGLGDFVTGRRSSTLAEADQAIAKRLVEVVREVDVRCSPDGVPCALDAAGAPGKVGPLTHDVDLLKRLERWLTTPAMQAMGRRLLLGYLGLSFVGAVVLGVAYVVVGRRGVAALGTGQGSTIDFATFLISWLIMGGLLVVYQQPRLLPPHLLFVGAFLFVAYGYLNMLREPHEVRYGDFTAYFIAATQIQAGQPLETVIAPEGPYYPYLYPPLLATLLAPVSSIGIDRLVQLFDLLNYAAVLLFTLLLYVALRQYRFTRQTAAIVAFLALIVNVAIMRTLIYRQINIVTADLILFSLTTYRSSKLLSAAALGVAVQLKVAPVLLVLVFVYLRDWAWVGWFVASQLLIVGATSLATSPNYYVHFVSQLMGLHETAVSECRNRRRAVQRVELPLRTCW